MKKWLIITGVLLMVIVFVVLNLRKEGSKVEVRTTEVKRRGITKLVTASGRIKAKRDVNVSAMAIGKITRLAVEEGDYVEKGDFLLQIDPTDYQSAVDQLKASIRAGDATVDMENASLKKAELDLGRAIELKKSDVVSDEELRNAQLTVDVQQARLNSALERLAELRATLKKASHDLSEVRIEADISGVVTELNVEEGENAIMGTINNPGTVLLVISDLSQIEAEVEVDETEVVFVEVGQGAVVTLDAYPDSSFNGVVTEVGNSAIRAQLGMGQSSVDFKVVILVQDPIPSVRPGLSASAKISVAEEHEVLAIPIQCLTVRRAGELEDLNDSGGSVEPSVERTDEEADIEGVFVVENGQVRYQPVTVGIAGSKVFHVKTGLEEGQVIVEGPFKAINSLKPGDPVKIKNDRSSER